MFSGLHTKHQENLLSVAFRRDFWRNRSFVQPICREQAIHPIESTFDVVIPENERDPELSDKLRAEWPGILAWAVHGCLEWQRDGLKTPDVVLEATSSYRKRADHVLRPPRLDVSGDGRHECSFGSGQPPRRSPVSRR